MKRYKTTKRILSKNQLQEHYREIKNLPDYDGQDDYLKYLKESIRSEARVELEETHIGIPLKDIIKG